MSEVCLTLREFADRIHSSYSTARRECIDGMVPGAFKVRTLWRIPESSVSEYMALHTGGAR